MPRRTSRLLDRLEPVWEFLSECFRRRPMFVVALIISSLIVVLAAITFVKTATEVNNVSNAFCNGQKRVFDAQQQRNCRDLFDKMLKNPSPEQRARIKEIVGTK